MSEYMRRLNLAISKGLIDRPTFYQMDVMHDKWCGIYASKECNCNPDITVETPTGKVAILADGSLKNVQMPKVQKRTNKRR